MSASLIKFDKCNNFFRDTERHSSFSHILTHFYIKPETSRYHIHTLKTPLKAKLSGVEILCKSIGYTLTVGSIISFTIFADKDNKD